MLQITPQMKILVLSNGAEGESSEQPVAKTPVQ
jgi:hypothetical protein